MSATHGKSLNASGKTACELLRRHPLRYISLDSTTEILFGVCKAVLIVVSGVLARIVFDSSDQLSQNEQSRIFIPIGILAIGAYFIAGLFSNLYSMAVDTMVLCAREYFCHRKTRSKGQNNGIWEGNAGVYVC